MMTPVNRRTFLAAGCAALAAGVSRGDAAASIASAFSRLKKKLEEGRPAILLIISDSTGYREESGTRRFVRWLAARYPAHRSTELRWAEWTSKGATGPKQYEAPLVLGEGTAGAAFTVVNAVLPGAYAQKMIDGSRWAPMLAPLGGQAPDLILWNHGHNHQANIPPEFAAYGRGTFFAPLGRVAHEFPESPHAAIIQNPWRDSDGYQRVLDWWQAVAAATPALTLVDGHAPFLAQGKSAALYQDNVHPNAQGYELIFRQLAAAWESSAAQDVPVPPSWVREKGEALHENGDLAQWDGPLPECWRIVNKASVTKDTAHTFGQAKYSLALTGTKQNDGIEIVLSEPALARCRGKTLSVAVLAFVPAAAEQDLQVAFATDKPGQVTGSILYARDNWKWVVLAGCPVPAEAKWARVTLFRSFSKPPTEVPFYIQNAFIVAGDRLCGGV